MRTETDRMLDTIAKIQHYFARCARNCQLGSDAYRRFTDYVYTLDKVADRLKEGEK